MGPDGPCWPLLGPDGPCWPLLGPDGPGASEQMNPLMFGHSGLRVFCPDAGSGPEVRESVPASGIFLLGPRISADVTAARRVGVTEEHKVLAVTNISRAAALWSPGSRFWQTAAATTVWCVSL